VGVALKWGSQVPSRCRARWFSPSGGSSRHGSSRGTEGARHARLAPRTSAPSCAVATRPPSLARPHNTAAAARPCSHTAVRCGGGRAEPQSKQNSRRASKQTNKQAENAANKTTALAAQYGTRNGQRYHQGESGTEQTQTHTNPRASRPMMVRKQTNKRSNKPAKRNKQTNKLTNQTNKPNKQNKQTDKRTNQTTQTNTRKPAALVARVEVAGVLGDQLEHLEVTDLRQPRDSAQQHSNSTRQSAMRHAPFHPPPPPPTP
jgi:hypothetical protein